MSRRLYKSEENRMVEGVCGGIAEYFGIDPALVRVGWVLFCVLGGSGVLAYIIAAMIIPRNPERCFRRNLAAAHGKRLIRASARLSGRKKGISCRLRR